MRVTNGMIMNTTLNSINSNMVSMSKLYAQMTTGKKIQTVSDDPIIAGRAMKLKVTVLEAQQYESNTKEATSWLGATETALTNMTKILDTIRDKCLYAANGTLTAEDKSILKTDIEELYEQLKQEVNATYGGRYIFSGYKTNEPMTYIKETILDEIFNIEKDYNISAGTTVGAGSTILKGSTLSGGTQLEAGSTLVDGTVLGNGTVLGDGTVLNNETVLGDGTVIGEGTTIPVGTELNTGSILGKGTNLPAGTVLPEGTVISAQNAVDAGLMAAPIPTDVTTYTVPVGGETIGADILLDGNVILKGDMAVQAGTVAGGKTQLAGETKLGGPMTSQGETVVQGTTTLKGNTTFTSGTVLNGKTVLLNDLKPGANMVVGSGSTLVKGSILEVGTTLPKGALNLNIYGKISGDEINYEIGVGSIITVNTVGMDEVMNDLNKHMEEMINTVNGALGEDAVYNSDELYALFDSKIVAMDDALSSVTLKTTQVGSRVSRLEYVQSRLTDDITNFKELLSETEDIDVEEVYVDFTSQYATYQAALQATSKVIMNTLADYI